MSRMIGPGVVVAGAAAGIAGSAALYFAVVGLLSLIGDSAGSEGLALSRRAWNFGTTFGLLSGAHWALAVAGCRLAQDRDSMRVARILCLALVVLGIALTLTGGRWNSMFGGLGGPGLVLVVAWLAMTHVVSKALDRPAPAGKPAGAAE